MCVLVHIPGTDTAGAGVSLSPGVEEAELQPEGFPALVPVSLRLPKVQCVHGQGWLLAAPTGRRQTPQLLLSIAVGNSDVSRDQEVLANYLNFTQTWNFQTWNFLNEF